MSLPAPPPRSSERIAKLLARAGVASRREIERMIAEGRVAVNGEVLTTPATVLPSLAGVTVDDQPVAAPEPTRLFAYHKPTGLLTAERDFTGRLTIYDRLPKDLPRVVPVGRLDLNTEGLLLLTTDGGLKRELELPRSGVERSYRARAYGAITQAQLEDLMDGVEVEGVRYGAINANLERRTGTNVWIELTLTEGKNREVRRVLEHLGLKVSRLIRTRYGPFLLGDLTPGEVVEIRQHDLVAFRKELALPPERRKASAPEEIIPPVNRAARRAEAVQEREDAAPPPERPQARPVAKPIKAAKEGPRRRGDARPSRPHAKPAAPERPRTGRPVRGQAAPGAALNTGADRRPRPIEAADRPDGRSAPARSGGVSDRPRAARPGDRHAASGTSDDQSSRPRARYNEGSDRSRSSQRPGEADRGSFAGRPRDTRPDARSAAPGKPEGRTRRPALRFEDAADRPRFAGRSETRKPGQAADRSHTARSDNRNAKPGRPNGQTGRSQPRFDEAGDRPRSSGRSTAPKAGDLVDRPRSAKPRTDQTGYGKPAGNTDRPRTGGSGNTPRTAGPNPGKPRPQGPRRPGPVKPRD